MASKTIDHMNLYVAVAEYQHENAPDQTFNCLRVYVSYRKGRGFIVGYHPGWGDARWWGCLLDVGDTNPLTGGLEALVKEATKNNAKLLQSMYDGLKQAQEHIAYLFNERDWQHLRHVMTMAAQGYNMDMFMRDLKHEAMVKQQVENGRKASGPKFRPATLEEIDGRDVDLYMNGERVYVLMVCRSETIETGESKLDYITLTNMKKVQVEDLYVIDNDNNEPNKEDQTMKLNLSNNNETKNAAKQQVTNSDEPIVKQVDVMGLMGALNRDGHAKLSDHVIEDAEAVEVKDEQAEEIESVNVGEVTLATIMPKMTAEPEPTKQEVSSSKFQVSSEPVNTGRTKFVVAGVPKPGETGDKPAKSEEGRVKSEEFATAAEKPQTSNLKSQTSRYAVQLLPAKSGGVWPKLYGFRSEKEAKAVAEKMPSSVTARWDYGVNGEGRETKTRHWYLSAGKRYCDVMQELADALNKGDRVAVANAAAKACGVYAGVVAENKSKNDSDPKPKREKKQEAKAEEKPMATGYSNADVAAMLKKIMAGGDIPENIKAAMAA